MKPFLFFLLLSAIYSSPKMGDGWRSFLSAAALGVAISLMIRGDA